MQGKMIEVSEVEYACYLKVTVKVKIMTTWFWIVDNLIDSVFTWWKPILHYEIKLNLVSRFSIYVEIPDTIHHTSASSMYSTSEESCIQIASEKFQTKLGLNIIIDNFA